MIVAEIRIYSASMSDLQRADVEQAFTDADVSAVPEPSPYALGVVGLLLVVGLRSQIRKA